jgi:hypothetical protein
VTVEKCLLNVGRHSRFNENRKKFSTHKLLTTVHTTVEPVVTFSVIARQQRHHYAVTRSDITLNDFHLPDEYIDAVTTSGAETSEIQELPSAKDILTLIVPWLCNRRLFL